MRSPRSRFLSPPSWSCRRARRAPIVDSQHRRQHAFEGVFFRMMSLPNGACVSPASRETRPALGDLIKSQPHNADLYSCVPWKTSSNSTSQPPSWTGKRSRQCIRQGQRPTRTGRFLSSPLKQPMKSRRSGSWRMPRHRGRETCGSNAAAFWQAFERISL